MAKIKVTIFKHYEVETPNNYDELIDLIEMEDNQTLEQVNKENLLRKQLLQDVKDALPHTKFIDEDFEENNIEYINCVEDCKTGECLAEF